jgi:hypothetical protein
MNAMRGPANEIIGHVAVVTIEEMRMNEIREFQAAMWATAVEANAM